MRSRHRARGPSRRAARSGVEIASTGWPRRPPIALAEAKRAVYEGVESPLADGLAVESDAFLASMLSDEGVAAMRSYVETPLDARRARAEPDPGA